MPQVDLIQEPNYRRGTATEWSSVNPMLMEREIGVESDTLRRKRGPGLWNSLPYLVPKMFFGSGPPPASLGAINDTYLDYETVSLYAAKTVNGWGGSIRLRSITSVQVNPLAAGATPTASLDNSTGTLTLGIPAGAKGDPGTPGAAGKSVTGITVTTLAAGANATASFDGATGQITLGVPRGATGQTGATGSVALVTATVSANIPLIVVGGTSTITLTVPGATTSMVPNVAPTDAAFAQMIYMTPPVVSAANTVTFKINALLLVASGTKSFLVKCF